LGGRSVHGILFVAVGLHFAPRPRSAGRAAIAVQRAGRLTGWPSALWTLALTVLVTLAGLVIARRRPQVVDVDIPVTGLPEALHGFSIAQISDVHVGRTIKRGFVEGIVALVNG